LREAFKAARDLSEDPNTQSGIVLVSNRGDIIARGATRLPKELRMEKDLCNPPEKYIYLDHAEKDGIYTAIDKGHSESLKGSTIYCTWTPCYSCANAIRGHGIKRLVTHQSTTDWFLESLKDYNEQIKWQNSIKIAEEYLKKCNVIYDWINNPLGGVTITFRNKKRSP
jgi:deoxycytidylate deaminase